MEQRELTRGKGRQKDGIAPRREFGRFGPGETASEMAARHFGEWNADRNPLKHAPARKSGSGESNICFPKFSEASQGRGQESHAHPSLDNFCGAIEGLVEGRRR
jgi:hypothetical protein